jgi:hypothetical protein
MENLALHPWGGPWTCLACREESRDAARIRYLAAAESDAIAEDRRRYSSTRDPMAATQP